MVRINVFAEPVKLAELRDEIGALRDTMELTSALMDVRDRDDGSEACGAAVGIQGRQ